MRHKQICSHLESSDATRIGLVVSFDDIHVMTMNVIMICLWNVDIVFQSALLSLHMSFDNSVEVS